MVLGPEASALHARLLEMQILGPHHGVSESGAPLRVGEHGVL